MLMVIDHLQQLNRLLKQVPPLQWENTFLVITEMRFRDG